MASTHVAVVTPPTQGSLDWHFPSLCLFEMSKGYLPELSTEFHFCKFWCNMLPEYSLFTYREVLSPKLLLGIGASKTILMPRAPCSPPCTSRRAPRWRSPNNKKKKKMKNSNADSHGSNNMIIGVLIIVVIWLIAIIISWRSPRRRTRRSAPAGRGRARAAGSPRAPASAGRSRGRGRPAGSAARPRRRSPFE